MPSDAALKPPPAEADPATLTGQLAASELHRGDVLAGRFRIESVLGIGGFGVVYRAHDLSLDIDVAVKLLRPELARRPEAFERFRKELLLARQVSSAHVVRIHDIAEHGGRWFISMDYVDGESLEHRLDAGARLTAAEAIAIVRGLLEGLRAAHERGVVHRDLKPANILIDRSGNALISDFGVALSLGATGATQTGIVVGTPEYLSPEQARGDAVDARSDLYAVGLMLYEMLAGTLPFSGGTPAETMMQRLVRPPPSLAKARPELPNWLHALCDRLLQTSPARRFASAQDALRALDARKVPRPPLDRMRVLFGLLVLALIAGAASWLTRNPPAHIAAPATATAVVERAAVLPLRVPADDAELAAIARALGEHAQAWLRADAARGSVPRRRVLDALARQTPGMDAAAVLRQLPEIAAAAAATQVLHGSLRRDQDGLLLDLSLWTTASAIAAAKATIRGADATALLVAYQRQAAQLFAAAGWHPGPPPPLPAAELVALGNGLLALDKDRAEAASALLAEAADRQPGNAIIEAALLQAQTAARQDLPAQATRERIVARFAEDTTPLGRELHALALAGNDQGDAAAQALARAVREFPNDAQLSLRHADALSSAGEGARALAALQHYVIVDDQDGRAWFLLGRTAIQQGRADAAVSNYLTRALVLARLRGDRAAEAETANALGVGFERLGQLDAAAQQYAQAAALREQLGDEEGLAKSLRNLAIVQAVHGDGKTADATLDRVRRLLEKRNDRASLAELYNDRGVVAEEHGAYAQALGLYRQALALRQELNLPPLVAESLNNVGFASYNLGDFDNALVFWQQALASYRKIDDASGALHIEESIGLLDIARGRFAAARERLAAALQAAEDHQLPEEAAVAHTYLGQLDVFEGRYADAATSAQHAAEIFARRSDQRGQAEAALLQADITLALGDSEGADRILQALQPDRLSAEQKIAFLLASARRARSAGDAATASRQLDAARAAAGSVAGNLDVRVQLEGVRLALAKNDNAGAARALAALRGASLRIGEVPLRLQWLQLEVAAALRAGKAADAAARYREALPILKTTGRWADAVLLHRLGARALAGRRSEADAARAAADAQQAQLLADAPPAAREDLRRHLDARWRAESGDDHGS
jgi:tetratricopeptide (TPR) repeat protein